MISTVRLFCAETLTTTINRTALVFVIRRTFGDQAAGLGSRHGVTSVRLGLHCLGRQP